MDSFTLMQQYVEVLVKTQMKLLSITSRHGLGKTSFVLSKMKELGVNYLYLSGHMTPLELFTALRDNPQAEYVVLDDMDALARNKTCTALLKQATFPNVHDKCIVMYNSSDLRAEESCFECNAKFIMLYNDLPQNPDVLAILNRGICYNMKPSNKEILQILLKRKENDIEVIEFLNTICKSTIPLNFRLYHQVKSIKETHPTDWKEIAVPIVKPNDKYGLIRELLLSGKSISQQIEDYKANTGKTERSYFREKAGMKNDC